MSRKALLVAVAALLLVPAALAGCGSARELAALGFADDVRVAAELDASDTIPELHGRSFVAAKD